MIDSLEKSPPSLVTDLVKIPDHLLHALDERDRLRREVRHLTERLSESVPSAEHAELLTTLPVLLAAGPVRPAPGIYFLLDETCTVVYVGQSGNVAARMIGHTDKEFTEIRMLGIEDADKRMKLEGVFIRTLRPKYNRDVPRA